MSTLMSMKRDPAITHKIMSSIKQRNTSPELKLCKELWRRGFRYRVNVRELAGKPDIAFTKYKIAIFCDGDFWHGHNWALRGYNSFEEELNQYSQFWREKLSCNVARDRRNSQLLESSGWVVIRIWESSINKDVVECVDYIASIYNQLSSESLSKNLNSRGRKPNPPHD